MLNGVPITNGVCVYLFVTSPYLHHHKKKDRVVLNNNCKTFRFASDAPRLNGKI